MNKNTILGLIISLLLTNCSLHNPGGTTVFHSDESHTGIYQTPNKENLGKLFWKYKTGGKIFSSPAVVDGVVYIGSEDSNMYAIGVSTGELIWKYKTGGAVSSSAAVFDQTVYFTSYDGNCYALDAGNGREKWKFKTGGEKKVGSIGLWNMKPDGQYMEDLWDFFLSSPLIDQHLADPTVYFGSGDGNLYALDAVKGTLNWKFHTQGIIHTSPALYRGMVYFGSWDTYLYAIDAQTGKEKWKFKTKDQPDMHLLEGIQASPTLSDGMVYFGARDGYFYALNAETGDMFWKYSAESSWILTTAAVKEGIVYFGTSDTYLMLALDAKTGKKKYAMKAAGYLYSSPAIAGRTAYYGDFTGNLYALDLNSGGSGWQVFSTEGRMLNAARILNKKGELDFAFTAGAQDLSLYETSRDVMNEFYNLGSIVSSPSIAGNTVYFGSADGYLYALERKN